MKPISVPRCFGVAGNSAKRLSGGSEQDVVHHSLVLVCNRGNLLRNCEDDMEILDRQQFSLPVFKPLSAYLL